MSETPSVSVVIASLDGALHIREQLDSIAGQTVEPLEILVGDDGSTDETLDIVRRFATTTNIPLHLTINDERLGYAENFLRTATAAKGALIAFADQDDVWFPGKLAAAVRAFEAPDLALWVAGWQIVDERLVPVPDRWLHTGFAQRSALAYPMHVAHGARMVFRSNLLTYCPAEGRARSVYGDRPAHHDEWVMFAAHVMGRVDWHPEPLMMYRRHQNAVSAVCPPIPPRRYLLRAEGEALSDGVELAARARSRYLLSRAAAPECQAVKSQLLEGARYYDQLVPRLGRRAVTRMAPERIQRLKGLTASVARGDYRPLSRGGLGVWTLLQDGYGIAR